MIRPGEVEIGAPSPGRRVVVGAPILVLGSASAGENTVNGAALPPTSVTVQVDGGSAVPATKTEADWLGWVASLQVQSPGVHVFRATARRVAAPSPVWQAHATVNVEATFDRLSVVGFEQTQAVQFCNVNAQGSAVEPDNSVALVAQKSTVVRIYVDRMSATSPPARVTGLLMLDAGPELIPVNGPIAAISQTSINRGLSNDTLNFILPASQCIGTRSCTVSVFDPDAAGPPHFEHQVTFSMTFAPVPRLRVHLVGVHITGPGGLNITAPSDVAMEASLGDVSRLTPVSGIDYTGYTVITFDGDLTGAPSAPGACNVGWSALLDELRVLRNGSGAQDVFIGLVNAATPLGQIAGCGAVGVAAARDGDVLTIAHELGHALDRQHVACGAPAEGQIDPGYPVYGAFPFGSIGEFGFNVRTGSIPSPISTFDIMAYCSPRWISPYTWRAMMNKIIAGVGGGSGGGGGSEAVAPEGGAAAGQYLYLSFRVSRSGDVHVLPSFHLHAPGPPPEPGTIAPVGCELVDADDRVLAWRHCRLEWNQSPDDPYVDYHTVLPWDPAAEAIRFSRDGETLHVYPLEREAPAVDLVAADLIGPDSRRARVEWVQHEPLADTFLMLRYTHDDGAHWYVVAAGLTEPQQVVNLEHLPGGDACRFQLVASAGVRTSVAETPPFAVPVKLVRARIDEPADGVSIVEGEPLTLRGVGYSPDFGATPFEDMAWSSDRDGPLDVGHEIALFGLPPGPHQFKLTVPNGLGGESVAALSVTVTPAGGEAAGA